MSHKSGFAGPVTIAVVGMVVLVPLLYILSAGPAIKLMSRGYISESALMSVYFPLEYVSENCAPLGEGIGWYLDLFRPADAFEVHPDFDVIYQAVPPGGATSRGNHPAASTGLLTAPPRKVGRESSREPREWTNRPKRHGAARNDGLADCWGDEAEANKVS